MAANSRQILNKLVVRGDELSLPTNIDGLYNQLLFDLCADDALLAFTLFGSYNPVLDVIGFETSNVNRQVVNFITYIAPNGTADETPSSGIQTDPCEPGESIESGFCDWTLKGWGRLRRSSPVRDITDTIMKYCETQPIYNIAGQRIEDDYVWDLTRITTVLLQDFQREIIVGNCEVQGSHDGLQRIIRFGYESSEGFACEAMDSFVIDYNGNAMCPAIDPETGLPEVTGVTINGGAPTDGFALLDYVNSWLRRTARRINMSSLTGGWNYIGLLASETLDCLIDCYVCFVTCGRDVSRMNEPDVRTEISRLKGELTQGGGITLNHQGQTVTWYPYDYEMVDGAGLADIYILTPTVGNTPLLRLQLKDMAAVSDHRAMAGAEMRVSDNGRILSWNNTDHTCFQSHTELQWRWRNIAPWAQLRITGIDCTPLFGHLSSDPLSPAFPSVTKVAGPVIPSDFNASCDPTPVLPTAAFTNVDDGLEVTFTDTSVANAGNIVAWFWTFGDGEFSNEQNPVHVYGGADTYTVTLTVTNSYGGQDSFADDVTVA